MATILLCGVDVYFRGKLEALLTGHHLVTTDSADWPDVVIADETTASFGAFGLSRELKMMSDPPRVIVILERSQDIWLAKWSGADRWFVRPVDPFELAETVNAREATPKRPAVHQTGRGSA